MHKQNGWEKILNDHILENLNKPQQWGEMDCCLFACNWIKKCSGIDPMKKFRGKYKTKTGAYKQIKKFGNDLEETSTHIANDLGLESKAIFMAKRGDVALVPGGDGPALGIVDLSGTRIVVHGEKGISFVYLKDAIRIWGIG